MRKIQELSSQEVLALAIRVEQANARRLRHFATFFNAKNESVAEKFMELAEEERKHELWLTQKFKKMFRGPLPDVDEFDVEGVVEAVEVEDPQHPIPEGLAAEDVFRLALQSENNARNFYQKAETFIQDRSLTRLFHDLAAMETDHVGWLENRMTQATPASGSTEQPGVLSDKGQG